MNQPAPLPMIALLTDFGTVDPYVGVMKGVIASRCPSAQVIDITHEVQPQNIKQGAYLLRSAYRYFPTHTIFLAVVDPGVGTARHPIGIETDHGYFVGPDNGLISAIVEDAQVKRAVVLNSPAHSISMTFHGRDLFAPAAADLACGRSLGEMGSPISLADLIRLPPPKLDFSHESRLEGEILHIDHFGNLITSVGPFEWRGNELILMSGDGTIRFDASRAQVVYTGRTRPKKNVLSSIQATYQDNEPGHLLALINSDGQLEIALNQGNAALLLNAQIGDKIHINFILSKDT